MSLVRSGSTRSTFLGFTLVELLVSTAIITLLLVILVQITAQTSATWRYTTGKAEQFRGARMAFETMTRKIAQATLNTYWDYDKPINYNSPVAPEGYVRQSELRFISGSMQSGSSANRLDDGSSIPRPTHGIFFQAPFGYTGDKASARYEGLDSLLNTWGYYLEVGDDLAFRPPHVVGPPIVRSRLMEMMQPTSAMNIYKYTSGKPGMSVSDVLKMRNYGDPSATPRGAGTGREWFQMGLAGTAPKSQSDAQSLSHVLAENIISLTVLPKLSEQDLAANRGTIKEEEKDIVLAPDYYYHSAERGQYTHPPAGLLNSKHQLPPVLQITMVAIDEVSAKRLGISNVNDDPFQVRAASFMTKASDYKKDLLSEPGTTSSNSLESRLQLKNVNYRIFTTNIYLRGAKWSKEQTK